MIEPGMSDSLIFFAPVLLFALAVFLLRASPLMRVSGGLVGTSWGEWIAGLLRHRLGGGQEDQFVRLARLILVLVKYGFWAWGFHHFDVLGIQFWTLVWTLLLVLALLRRQAEFQAPSRWEHVSLKLDAEHFWLIHLALLGTAELYLPSSHPWGLVTLVAFHMLVNGESDPSLLSSFEDVVGVGLSLLALWSLAPKTWLGIPGNAAFFTVLACLLPARGPVRAALGRDWLRRRFWWIAQFCLMTSLLVKAMAVLNDLPLPRP